jgi:predicted deacylase
MAEVFGVGITVQTSNMGDYRTSAGYASKKGIPTLAAEMGMGGWVTGASVQATREATLRCAAAHRRVAGRVDTVPGTETRWTRIAGPRPMCSRPVDGYFERRFDARRPGARRASSPG